jgi:ABC-type bacteriocin/lantibiotic exporter with double-glycine peptidase domain
MFPLYGTIWRISSQRQIVLIALSLGIATLAAVPLKFQQEIVNLLTEGSFQASQLFLLGSGMIGVILLSLALKWSVGYRSNLLGEDAIRFIRTILLRRAVNEEKSNGDILTGTLSTAISAEAEELGKFAGIAFSEPVIQIGTLISVVVFVASTQPGLGIVAFAMIVPQITLVLFSQRKVNALLTERVRVLRRATDEISAPQLQSVVNTVLEDFDEIYEIRRTMFKWKLSTKFLLSAITAIGTVVVFMLGGLLVLRGTTDVGTVVAATMGLSRLQGPNTFLISFYRQVSANRVKFELLRELSVHKDMSAS